MQEDNLLTDLQQDINSSLEHEHKVNHTPKIPAKTLVRLRDLSGGNAHLFR